MRGLILSLLLIQSCSDVRFQPKKGETGKAVPQAPAFPAPTPAPQAADAAAPSESQIYSGDLNRAPAAINPTVVEQEQVTAPNHINGSLLHCSRIVDAVVEKPIAIMGCRLQTADGKRMDLNPALYSYSMEVQSTATFNISIRPPEAFHHFWVDFKGVSAEDANRAASEAVLRFLVKDKAGVTVDVHQGTSKELDRGNVDRGRWSIYGERIFQDHFTGLFWNFDDDQSFTQPEGVARCEGMTIGGRSDWRLPSIEEMQVSVGDGLGVTAAEDLNMNLVNGINKFFWTSSSTQYATGVGVYTINLVAPDIGRMSQPFIDSGTRGGVLCVSERMDP